jgi:hypothetical protein
VTFLFEKNNIEYSAMHKARNAINKAIATGFKTGIKKAARNTAMKEASDR